MKTFRTFSREAKGNLRILPPHPPPPMKLILISHIYNEEYLLPFWLNHHKSIFDHGIIINYNSTDKSVSIIKEICPEWIILNSKNKYYTPHDVDKEVMYIETKIDYYKICLNVTEYLFCDGNIKDFLINKNNICIEIKGISLLSKKHNNYYNPLNLKELFDGIEYIDIITRSPRYLHSYKPLHYSVGRHSVSENIDIKSIPAYIGVFCYYPWNDNFIKRKTQQKTKMKVELNRGCGSHLYWSVEEMINTRNNLLEKSYEINKFPTLVKIFNEYKY